MNKTIYLINRKNENRLANIVKGKCRTIMYERTDDITKVDIRGISLRDWIRISPDIMKLELQDIRA